MIRKHFGKLGLELVLLDGFMLDIIKAVNDLRRVLERLRIHHGAECLHKQAVDVPVRIRLVVFTDPVKHLALAHRCRCHPGLKVGLAARRMAGMNGIQFMLQSR